MSYHYGAQMTTKLADFRLGDVYNSMEANIWVFDMIFFSSENWDLGGHHAEISIGNTLEISTIFASKTIFFCWKTEKIILHKFRYTAEISKVLPIEISASKRKKFQFSLEKKIKSK